MGILMSMEDDMQKAPVTMESFGESFPKPSPCVMAASQGTLNTLVVFPNIGTKAVKNGAHIIKVIRSAINVVLVNFMFILLYIFTRLTTSEYFGIMDK